MDYRESLDYLYGLGGSGGQPAVDLERVRALLAKLGDPHRGLRCVHIAGTKGKGSTAAMFERCLAALGQRVGLYSSPHLHTFRERVRINGELITRQDVASLATRVREAAAGLAGITTFDTITALGLLYFAERGVDWAVVEVGLGGRLDPTNVILPRVCVITSLSFDHTAILGRTLAEIAAEKAGILKPGVPAVVHVQPAEAAAVIEATARSIGAPLTWLGRHWRWHALSQTVRRQVFDVKQVSFRRSTETPNPNDLEGVYELQLAGKHQLDNATGVIAALDLLRANPVNQLAAPRAAVQVGLAATIWPGRFEVLREEPALVVDSAHNVDSINKLAMTLTEVFAGRRWTVIFGCYTDKDAEGMLRALAPRAARWVFVQGSNARARPAADLLVLGKALNLRNPVIAESVMAAVNAAREAAEPVVVCGSVTLAGDARAAWLRGAVDTDADMS